MVILFRVPSNKISVDGQIRFNHSVPAIPRRREEEEEFVAGSLDAGVSESWLVHWIRGIRVYNLDDRLGFEWAQCNNRKDDQLGFQWA